jgi:DNA-binding transcriptional LysR family regulator
MSINFDKLQYFVAVARLEHVGRAAKSVGISPSVISAAITSLEEEYGCQLFDRRQNRIFLNNTGMKLLIEAEKILESVKLLPHRISKKKEELEGKYRIGASHFLAMKYLSPAWVKLQKKHPRLIGEVSSVDTGVAIAEVLAGRLDFAVVFSPFLHQDIYEKKLHEGQFYISTKIKHPVYKESPSPVHQVKLLNQYPSITFHASKGQNYCENHPIFREFDINPTHTFYYDNDFMAVDHLTAFNSWALLPDLVIEHFQDKLTAIKPKLWNAPMSVSVISSFKGREDLVLQELTSILSEAF